jgi:hypothetical protein
MAVVRRGGREKRERFEEIEKIIEWNEREKA